MTDKISETADATNMNLTVFVAVLGKVRLGSPLAPVSLPSLKVARNLLAALVLVWLSIPAGAADENVRASTAPAPTLDQPVSSAANGPTIYNYNMKERTCVAWTDGCVNCMRIENDQSRCSNIGPVCQPQEIRCLDHK